MLSSKLTLYVIRVNSSGQFVDSSPCMDCTRVMRMYNVNKIIYSNEFGNITKLRFKDYIPKTISVGRKYINSGYYLPIQNKKKMSSSSLSTIRS